MFHNGPAPDIKSPETEEVTMSFMQWNDALSIKIDKFDSQHKKLIDLVNDLQTAMMQRKGNEIISTAIKMLIDYTQTHFKEEEMFLKKHNYPELDAHSKEHAGFVNAVLGFKKQYEAGTLSTTVQLFSFLNTWITQHIKKSDAKYGQALAGKPV
jgi:hemerythrin-like metal-binding protein